MSAVQSDLLSLLNGYMATWHDTRAAAHTRKGRSTAARALPVTEKAVSPGEHVQHVELVQESRAVRVAQRHLDGQGEVLHASKIGP